MAEVNLDEPIDLKQASDNLFLRWNVRQCALVLANTLTEAQLLDVKPRYLRVAHLEILTLAVISEWIKLVVDRHKALGLRTDQNRFLLESTEDLLRNVIGKVPD